MDLGKTILVWRFYDAPYEYKILSEHGGDEDWLALVPSDLLKDDAYIAWLQDPGTAFGCCDVSQHPVEGGMVFIGAHS